MKLSDTVLEGLADMVVGDHPLFPYRPSSRITRFFRRCGFSYVHDGSTRKWWAKDRLAELNLGPSHAPDLPSDDLLRIISELFEPEDFEKDNDKEREPALEALNKLLKRTGLVAYFDASASDRTLDLLLRPDRARQDRCQWRRWWKQCCHRSGADQDGDRPSDFRP
jgi:hypothetical protein